MPQSIERILIYTAAGAAEFFSDSHACVRLLRMSRYCRGGALFARCSICLPVLFAERADHSCRARSRSCPSAPSGPAAPWVCRIPLTQLTVEHLGARVDCANSRLRMQRGHSSAGIAVNGVAMALQYGNLVLRVPRRSKRCRGQFCELAAQPAEHHMQFPRADHGRFTDLSNQSVRRPRQPGQPALSASGSPGQTVM